MTSGTLAANGVLLDTGPLVALYAKDDKHHASAARWMADFNGQLHTVESVLTEAAYFLPAHVRPILAELVTRGTIVLHGPDAAGYARIAELLRKYADRNADWADIALVWLAETSGVYRIATLDVADFSTYRIKGRKRFELEWLG